MPDYLRTMPMRVRGNWPCLTFIVVLSVLAPTWVSGSGKHHFGQGLAEYR